MSYTFNKISITIKGTQEHINLRNKVWDYPMNQKFIALEDLKDHLMSMNYEHELPNELVNDVIFDCRDYIIKIHFYNEFYIIESSYNKGEIYTEFYTNEEEADEAFQFNREDCIVNYEAMGDLNPIRNLNLYASKYHYKGQEQEPHEMISKAELIDLFKIHEVEGKVEIIEKPLIF